MTVGGEVLARRACRATPPSSGSTAARNSSGGKPPQRGFHSHLWPMAQTLRVTPRGSVMPQSVAATMSQCSSAVAKRVALVGIVAQPVQQLGEAPLGRVDAAAPVDRFEVLAARAAAVISCGFVLGAMVAPEVVVVERLQVCVHRDDARAGGVERDALRSLARRRRPRSPARCMAATSASMWSAWDCVAKSGSSRLRDAAGIRAVRRTERVRASLSTMETRTLRVPKSTPATMA